MVQFFASSSKNFSSRILHEHDKIAERFTNLSDTYGFKFADHRAETLRQAYTRVIDKAIYEIQAGITDYNTAMRQTVKDLSDSGIRVVDFESGYSRRVDSQARMNVLDGVRRLCQEMNLYHGERFGSDGVELSAHAMSAPDHAPVQGRQFSNEEFNRMQEGEGATDVNGREYEPFERPIGEWNCKHFALSIIIGVSEPAYTEEQLQKMLENSRKKYDITQAMRKKETAIRRLKERRMSFSAAGNELDAVRTQRSIDKKIKEYKKFCADNELAPKLNRTEVEGYRRIKTGKKALTTGGKGGIIKSRSEGKMDLEIDKFTPCLEDAKTGEIVKTAFSLASRSELENLQGWKFKWTDKSLEKAEIYKLVIAGDDKIQGLVALTDFKKDKAIYVDIAESAPHNLGKGKKYDGVGGHLFAIAVKKSMELGYDGFVFMDAKNIELIKHYSDTLGAVLIGGAHPYRMIIDETAAKRILESYTL